MVDRISQQHDKISTNYARRLTSQREISDIRSTVVAEDLSLAAKFECTTEDVKQLVKDYYGKVVDRDLLEIARQNGSLKLREAVELLDSLPKRWNDIQKELSKLQAAKNETINRFAEFLGTDTSTPLFKVVNNYGHFEITDPQQLAEVFVNSKDSIHVFSYGLSSGERDRSVDQHLEEVIQKQIKLSRVVGERDVRSIFPDLVNPEKIALLLNEEMEFYRKFQAALSTPDEVAEKIRCDGRGPKQKSFGVEIEVKDQYQLGLDGQNRQVSPNIVFDSTTLESLRRASLSEVKKDLNKHQAELEAASNRLKRQIDRKVDMDWVSTELDSFRNQHKDYYYSIIQEGDRFSKDKLIAQDTIRDLTTEKIKASDRLLNEPVRLSYSVGGSHHSDRYYIAATAMDGTISAERNNYNATKVEIENLAQSIAAKQVEKPGFWGAEKRKTEIAQELVELNQQRNAKIAEREVLAKKIQQLEDERNAFNRIYSMVVNVPRAVSDESILGDKGLTFGGAIDLMITKFKEVQDLKLDPKKQKEYEEYSRLKTTLDKLQRNYEEEYGR